MSLAFFLRNNLNRIPYPIGKFFSLIPYDYRPGLSNAYRTSRKDIQHFSSSSISDQKIKIFDQVKQQISKAYEEIHFYQDTYNKNGFDIRELESFEDLKKIPIINKDQLLEYDLEQRSNLSLGGMKANTGGSSGKPLTFHTPAAKMGREWAHLHHIWKEQMNFKFTEVKLMVMGRADIQNYIEYDFLRHSLKVDIYRSYQKLSEEIEKNFKGVPIHFLHGYPSAIYELALYCRKDQILLNLLRENLKGCILNSEFPHIHHRKIIEETFNIKSYAFYGHSEGCVIAYETSMEKYKPLHSYGFAEAIEFEGEMNLVGTNFYNNISPLIRYNTEDKIEKPEFEEDLLSAFKMKKGRNGEFILDKEGKTIPLTGLIFGRHHKLFDYCKHIQVRQITPGKAEILYVAKNNLSFNAEELFDSQNINVDFSFKQSQSPVRTLAGKVNLLVKDA